MIQGTASNAGKSLIAAGLCRIFAEDGYRVAPFKAQNMALNSFITEEGLEMGRAQVVQAEAAGRAPSVLMNPVLLKPTDDRGSQVIVMGEVWKNMSASQYYRHKREIVPYVKEAFEKLSEQNDIIVIEGAGSPAEINLKENDIVNMYMARLAEAPVLLAGDIDRGGVFASLAGTLLLLDSDEKKYLKGFIINKFRGDPELLKPGLRMLEEMTQRPVAGVIPFLDVDIDDEDSLSERFGRRAGISLVDIAVIRLPRISNFTDMGAFDAVEGVSVRYPGQARELGNPDLIVIPGTKNTMGDLMWMRESGMEAAVKKLSAAGTPVFGICGGYQMLGESLEDPYGVEHGGAMRGMGLLPGKTVFEKEKRRTRVKGRFESPGGIFKCLSGMEIEGYEIHMGATDRKGEPLVTIWEEEGKETADGMSGENVWGSYVHGIFDGEGIAAALARELMKAKGMDPGQIKEINVKEYRESQYSRLAGGIRKAMDMDLVYSIIEKGI